MRKRVAAPLLKVEYMASLNRGHLHEQTRAAIDDRLWVRMRQTIPYVLEKEFAGLLTLLWRTVGGVSTEVDLRETRAMQDYNDALKKLYEQQTKETK